MIRFLPCIVCLLLLSWRLPAQSIRFGNEWINYKQSYYKIPVAQSGIYRISFTDLQKAGIPLSTIDPTTLQLFHRGVEQAITVTTEANKKFDATDYIEFYGRANDGTQDSLLYRPNSAQPHKYYSLFSDTTAYFLTWQTGKTGRRMQTAANADVSGLSPEPYHWAEELRVFTDTYPGYAAGIPPKTEYSYFEEGEGYSGPILPKDSIADRNFTLSFAYRNGPQPRVNWLLAGREYTYHRVEFLAGPSTTDRQSLGAKEFNLYNNQSFGQTLNWNRVQNNGQLIVSTVSRISADDRYSVSYIQLRYPQLTVMGSATQKTFNLVPNPAGRALLEIPDAPQNLRLTDITDPQNPIPLSISRQGTVVRAIITNASAARTILATTRELTSIQLLPVQFREITTKANYLIIAHPAIRQPVGNQTDPVKSYADYRASKNGGGFDTLTVNIQQLFDQFSFGERNSLAIRRFMDFMLAKGPVEYALIIGRGRSGPGVRKNAQQWLLDMVPTFGYPGSDSEFSTGLKGAPADLPAIPTGRINAATPQDVINYLNKVKEQESLRVGQLWRKRILHLSGGHQADEIRSFRQIVDNYRTLAESQPIGAKIRTFSKVTDNNVEYFNLAEPVNEGVGMITFFGHSSLNVTDLDIGLASSDPLGYRNKGKYPFLLINGCAIGNFFFGLPTLATDWVLTPDRGAIAAIAQSHVGFATFMDRYTSIFYEVLADSLFLSRSIGKIQQETIRRILDRNPLSFDIANLQQMVLQGDPAVRIFPFDKPDYAIDENKGVQITPTDGKPLTTLTDSVKLQVVVMNVGQYHPQPVTLQIKRLNSAGETIAVYNTTVPNGIAFQDTLHLSLPNDRSSSGLNRFEVVINPTGTIQEVTTDNNGGFTEINIPGPSLVPLLPSEFGIVRTASNPASVSLVIQTYRTDKRPYVIQIDTSAAFNSAVLQSIPVEATTLINQPVKLPSADSTTYFWRVRLADTPVNTENNWHTSSFTLVRQVPDGWWQRHPAQFARNNGSSTERFTPPIGPAQSWKYLTWVGGAQPATSIEVWGIDPSGQEKRLINLTTAALIPLELINPAQYPYLRLKSVGNPSSVTNWRIAFTGVPEGFAFSTSPTPTTLLQGQPGSFTVNFTNLSATPFTDSVLVRYTLYAEALASPKTIDRRMAAPAPGNTSLFTIPVETVNLPGINQLVVTVNPQLQSEQTFQNNVFDIPFRVVPDKRAPVVEVSFDGERIRDSSTVSVTPTIELMVADENPYMLRCDTTGLDLYLQGPCEKCPTRRISWRSPEIKGMNSSPNNRFILTFMPNRLAEGRYRLQFNARDLAGNAAAPVIVNFKVITDRNVVSVQARPNPFSDFVRLEFTLSGPEAPDEATLTIIDLNGRPVWQTSGPVRIGTNSWAWDGWGASGSKLPNGMYLFRITIQSKGEGWPFSEALQGRLILAR